MTRCFMLTPLRAQDGRFGAVLGKLPRARDGRPAVRRVRAVPLPATAGLSALSVRGDTLDAGQRPGEGSKTAGPGEAGIGQVFRCQVVQGGGHLDDIGRRSDPADRQRR